MKSMYVIGASELAIHGTSSWDQLFTDHDLELLEYASDIRVIYNLCVYVTICEYISSFFLFCRVKHIELSFNLSTWCPFY